MGIGSSSPQAELERLSPPTNPAQPITDAERRDRLETARRRTQDMGAQALLIGAGPSLRYFTGLPWGASERLIALLLPVRGEPIMIAPRFERASLEAEISIVGELRFWEEDESPFAIIGNAMSDWNAKVLAVDPALTFEMVHRLGQETGLSLLEGSDVIRGCRMIKSEAELALMRQAKQITLQVHLATARALQEGVSNIEVTSFIDAAHRRLGVLGNTFCIVQFGQASAAPHGLPGIQTLKENDLVLIDTGCAVEGYLSDITRTYSFGRPSSEQRRIWDIEKEAQTAAFASIEIGKPCEIADAAARAVLSRYGLGPDYNLPGLPHRTGHGIGLSIHEAPYLVRGDKTPLAKGMCFSNEPMIVVPGQFGIRLEDHMHVSDSGAHWFTEPQAAIDRL